jgi:hypothetical protein
MYIIEPVVELRYSPIKNGKSQISNLSVALQIWENRALTTLTNADEHDVPGCVQPDGIEPPRAPKTRSMDRKLRAFGALGGSLYSGMEVWY